jgi:hypothetical protein
VLVVPLFVVLIPSLPVLVVITLRVAALFGKALFPPTKKALSTSLNVLSAKLALAKKLFGLIDSVLPLIKAVPTRSRFALGCTAAETNPLI